MDWVDYFDPFRIVPVAGRLAGVLIETERLQLRPLGPADLDALVALHAAPQVSRFTRALPRDAAREWLGRCEQEWHDRGHGLLAIYRREDGRFLGRAGLRYWPQFDETELGWVLHPDVWGHGYATEAASASAEWGFQTLGVSYLTAMIRPDNARSLRVADRLGMTRLREDVLSDAPVIVYAIDRSTGSRHELLHLATMRVPHDHPKYVVGQYVEIITTVSSSETGSVQSGTRGVIQAIDLTEPDDRIYRVAFLGNERPTGETAWMREIDLLPS